ncbi:MAG: hypothetical protein AB8B69_13635 [Chitinophagales bacterium]
MWTSQTQILAPNKVLQYKILQDGKTMSFEQVIHHWKNTAIFRAFYNGILADSPFEAFFWEVLPMTKDGLQQDFEFVLVNSDTLTRIRANKSPFQEHFDRFPNEEVITFPNLSGDAQLVVPTPQTDLQNYAHLANVVRNAPDSQIDELWKMIGVEYEKALQQRPKWLSTAGLGVLWLHIRIDSRPKYYRFKAYKQY